MNSWKVVGDDGVLFAERANESERSALSKLFWSGGVAKASVNSACDFHTLSARDPKPSELAMDRVNFAEKQKEARTRESCNTLG